MGGGEFFGVEGPHQSLAHQGCATPHYEMMMMSSTMGLLTKFLKGFAKHCKNPFL